MDLEARFRDAVVHFWDARDRQAAKQREGGKIDAGTRGAVTGGTQMGAIEVLIRDILLDAGLEALDIRTSTALELPGYYRIEKKWDLLVVSRNRLVLAIELKSQVGSFGNNLNSRVEEAIGNAADVWTAYRENRFGTAAPQPFLGFFFLLEDTPKVHQAVGFKEPYFQVDPVFHGASYAKRYEILCQRLVHERLYTSACLTLSGKEPLTITHPAPEISFTSFAAAIEGHAITFRKSVEHL